jgi:hypothetical protein
MPDGITIFMFSRCLTSMEPGGVVPNSVSGLPGSGLLVRFLRDYLNGGMQNTKREKTQQWERNTGVKQRIEKHKNFIETSVWNTGILIASKSIGLC